MKGLKACWKVGWRVGVCALLLLWIFHSIFLNEGRLAAQSAGLDWQTLSRAQQWHLAWTNGPRDLWHTLCLTPLWALVSSTLVVGLALFGGVVRWRIVLEAQGLHLPLGRATRISLVAQFFNSFLLGSTGGAGNPPQKNGGGDDGFRGPAGGVMGDAAVRQPDDAAEL
jgi:hypothetical protein